MILSPANFNRKFNNSRRENYFIGVEDLSSYDLVTIHTDNKIAKSTTILSVRSNGEIFNEKNGAYKSSVLCLSELGITDC